MKGTHVTHSSDDRHIPSRYTGLCGDCRGLERLSSGQQSASAQRQHRITRTPTPPAPVPARSIKNTSRPSGVLGLTVDRQPQATVQIANPV